MLLLQKRDRNKQMMLFLLRTTRFWIFSASILRDSEAISACLTFLLLSGSSNVIVIKL